MTYGRLIALGMTICGQIASLGWPGRIMTQSHIGQQRLLYWATREASRDHL